MALLAVCALVLAGCTEARNPGGGNQDASLDATPQDDGQDTLSELPPKDVAEGMGEALAEPGTETGTEPVAETEAVTEPGTETLTETAVEAADDAVLAELPDDSVAPPLTCHDCHGDAASPAPPPDTQGNTSTSAKGVGFHRAHLAGVITHAPTACNQCHVVPAQVLAQGHMNGTAEVVFGSLATHQGELAPAWDGATTCSNVYCHGATLSGGSNKQPGWTTGFPQGNACGYCHGYPPPAPHAQMDSCSSCHPVFDAQGAFLDGKHVNGTLDVAGGACNTCHGSDDNPAPPLGTNQEESTSAKAVGAHQSHLKAAHTISSPIACTECHLVPQNASDPGHLDTALPAEVTFGTLARTGGAQAQWSDGSVTCTSVYCHGATLQGGSNKTPAWTTVNGTQAACGTCHALPPKTGRHPNNFGDHAWMGSNCTNCHDGMTNTTGNAVTNPALHVNGVKDVKLKIGTWSGASKTCNSNCHEEVVHW
jgi:predicted CxxxxCH...CXXCH cytochrome family protein